MDLTMPAMMHSSFILNLIFNQNLDKLSVLMNLCSACTTLIAESLVLDLIPAGVPAWRMASGKEGVVIRANSQQGKPFPCLQETSSIENCDLSYAVRINTHTHTHTRIRWVKVDILDFFHGPIQDPKSKIYR